MQFSPKRSVDEESHRDFQNIDVEKLGNLQVLRLEVRLNNSKVLRRKLAKVGFLFEEGNPITFRDVFNSEIARKLNAHYWKQIDDMYRGMIFCKHCGKMITPDVKHKPNGHIHRYLFCPYCKDTRINENIITLKLKMTCVGSKKCR